MLKIVLKYFAGNLNLNIIVRWLPVSPKSHSNLSKKATRTTSKLSPKTLILAKSATNITSSSHSNYPSAQQTLFASKSGTTNLTNWSEVGIYMLAICLTPKINTKW
jgi:hypothetical protein